MNTQRRKNFQNTLEMPEKKSHLHTNYVECSEDAMFTILNESLRLNEQRRLSASG